jgi:hypothetical protein
MKTKIRIEIKEGLYRDIEIASARENRTIDEVIESAIAAYLQQGIVRGGKKLNLSRLSEPDPLQLQWDQIRRSMESDFLTAW